MEVLTGENPPDIMNTVSEGESFAGNDNRIRSGLRHPLLSGSFS